MLAQASGRRKPSMASTHMHNHKLLLCVSGKHLTHRCVSDSSISHIIVCQKQASCTFERVRLKHTSLHTSAYQNQACNKCVSVASILHLSACQNQASYTLVRVRSKHLTP
eukprot:1157472-Pelagomonas_calceolata.AAC.10